MGSIGLRLLKTHTNNLMRYDFFVYLYPYIALYYIMFNEDLIGDTNASPLRPLILIMPGAGLDTGHGPRSHGAGDSLQMSRAREVPHHVGRMNRG